MKKAHLYLAEEGGHNFKTTALTLQISVAQSPGADSQTLGSVPLTVGLSDSVVWFSLADMLLSVSAAPSAGQVYKIEADEGNTLLGTAQFNVNG